MSATKKKRAIAKVGHKEEVNKKAIIWVGSIAAVIVILIAVLLIVSP